MPRKRRFYLPGVAVHVVQRGHSREPVFFEDSDHKAFLHWMREACDRYGCHVHAYVLMTNHVHFLMTPDKAESISRAMQYVGRHYVPRINRLYGTSGTCWEGRYKACLVQDNHYLLSCMRYIELNPVRAQMVCHPRDYPWSSYRANGEGWKIRLVQPHPSYLALGSSRSERMAAYRALFKSHICAAELQSIRTATQTGTPLGGQTFRDKIEKKLQCKVGQARRGRPSKRALTP